jgi:hypothetical protein
MEKSTNMQRTLWTQMAKLSRLLGEDFTRINASVDVKTAKCFLD